MLTVVGWLKFLCKLNDINSEKKIESIVRGLSEAHDERDVEKMLSFLQKTRSGSRLRAHSKARRVEALFDLGCEKVSAEFCR